MYNNIKNKKKLYPILKANDPFLGLLWLLPYSDCNNRFSRKLSSIALSNQQEIRTITLVIGKLDKNNPLPSGQSRLSGFNTYLLEKYKESILLDKLARRTNLEGPNIITSPQLPKGLEHYAYKYYEYNYNC